MPEGVYPYSIEAEQSVIGSVLIDPTVLPKLIGLLTAESFFQPEHSRIWAAIESMYSKGGDVDLVTLGDELRRRGDLDVIGGHSYLIGLAENTPTSAYAEHYARLVAEKWALRKLLQHMREIAHEVTTGNENLVKILDKLEENISHLRQFDLSREDISLKESAESALNFYRDLATSDDAMRPLGWGISPLEDAPPLTAGGLHMLMAQTGVGKSLLALQLAMHAARTGRPTVIYSLEMPHREVGERALVQSASISLARGRAGKLTSPEYERAERVIQQMEKLPVWIEDRLDDLNRIIHDINRRYYRHGLRFAIVDYLGLLGMEGDDKYYQQLFNGTAKLKRLAMKLEIPIMVLHQNNRLAEKEEPSLWNVGDSYSAVRNADQVFFLWRPRDHEGALSSDAWLIVGKARNYVGGRYRLYFDENSARFL